jgi:hypothetical protein
VTSDVGNDGMVTPESVRKWQAPDCEVWGSGRSESQREAERSVVTRLGPGDRRMVGRYPKEARDFAP